MWQVAIVPFLKIDNAIKLNMTDKLEMNVRWHNNSTNYTINTHAIDSWQVKCETCPTRTKKIRHFHKFNFINYLNKKLSMMMMMMMKPIIAKLARDFYKNG